MGKPFKVSEQDPRVNITRGPDGKFQRLEQESAGKVNEEAKSTGEDVTDVARGVRVPPYPTTTQPEQSGDDVVHKETHPWPELGPTYNDAGRPPMKLKDS